MSATRRHAVALLAGFATIVPGTPGRAETTRVTFVLVNDIYLMGDEPMPDGQRRGGFPRLAAVVKAERAKGGHVLFAHGGDTLSPSLMSGIDHGAHIIRLTNMIRPDIFVPGNHEFDFGKDDVLPAHGGGGCSRSMPPTCAGPTAQPLPNFKDRTIVTRRRRAHRAHRRDLRPVRLRRRAPGDLKFAADGRDHRRRRPRRCAARARTSSSGSRTSPAAEGYAIVRHRHCRSPADRSHPRPVHQLRRP